MSGGRLVVAEAMRWSEVATVGSDGCVCMCEGWAKNERLLSNKQGQRRDVRAQRRDVPERGATNVMTFQRGSKSNVTTLGSNVVTFQRSYNPTSRRCDPTSQRSREAIIQRRDVAEGLFFNVVTLKSNVATFQGVEIPTSRH